MEGESIDELEMELPPFTQIKWGHTEFLLGLPDSSLEGSLTRFEASTGAIDLAGAESPFLTNHQDLPLPAHEAEGGPHGRLPAFPKSGVLGIHGMHYYGRIGCDATVVLAIQERRNDYERD